MIESGGLAPVLRVRIREAIRAHGDKALCNRCLVVLVASPDRPVGEAVRRIEGEAEFRRFYGQCGLCGRARLVIAQRSREGST